MKKLTRLFVVFALVAGVAGGCTRRESAKVAASVDQDFVNAYDAFEKKGAQGASKSSQPKKNVKTEGKDRTEK